MLSIQSTLERTLCWRQSGLGVRDFELTVDDEFLARLSWPKCLSDRADATCADGRWYFDRLGCFREEVTGRDRATNRELARFVYDLFGDGELRLENGMTFQLFRTKVFREQWALVDEDDVVVLEIDVGTHWFKYVVDVRIAPYEGECAYLPILVIFSWYLVFMRIQDVAAVVAATTAAS